MRKDKIVLDNKGFSLVELIVVVLITGILMLAVVMFISTSRSAYQTVNTSATLQEESIAVERILTEFIKESKACGYEADYILTDGSKVDVFWVKARDNERTGTDLINNPYSIFFFVLDKTKERLLYTKSGIDMIDGSGYIASEATTKIENDCKGENAKYHLIGNHIVGMTPTKYSHGDGSELICINLTYNYVGKEFKSTITAVARNKYEVTESTSGGTTGT